MRLMLLSVLATLAVLLITAEPARSQESSLGSGASAAMEQLRSAYTKVLDRVSNQLTQMATNVRKFRDSRLGPSSTSKR